MNDAAKRFPKNAVYPFKAGMDGVLRVKNQIAVVVSSMTPIQIFIASYVIGCLVLIFVGTIQSNFEWRTIEVTYGRDDVARHTGGFHHKRGTLTNVRYGDTPLKNIEYQERGVKRTKNCISINSTVLDATFHAEGIASKLFPAFAKASIACGVARVFQNTRDPSDVRVSIPMHPTSRVGALSLFAGIFLGGLSAIAIDRLKTKGA